MHYPLAKRAALMDYLKAHPPTRLLRSPLAEVKSFDGVKLHCARRSWPDAAGQRDRRFCESTPEVAPATAR